MAGRRRRALPALAAIVLVPALPLAVATTWAAGTDAEPAPAGNAPLPTDRTVPRTPVLSLRRAPETLAAASRDGALRAALAPVGDVLNDTSCLQVDVGGTPLVAIRSQDPVIPASNAKLLTAAAALATLGADHSFETTVTAAMDDEGVVGGDLYLIGGGDPMLSTDFYPDSLLGSSYPQRPATRLEDLADAVVAAGVVAVDGDVVGDGSRYDDERFRPAWPDDIRVTSAGPYGALMVNDARMDTAGTVAADPAQGAAVLFADLLRERGVSVGGAGVAGTADPDADVVAVLESPPLATTLPHMMQTSDNNSAEMLLKEVAVGSGRPGTSADGLAVVDDVLTSWGVPTAGVALTDGSGLDIESRATCAALTGVLAHEGARSVLADSLPLLGEEGTLQGVFDEHPLAGRLGAKTGSLGQSADRTDVKSLSGVLRADGAPALEFSLVLNGGTVREEATYYPIWEALFDALATYPGGVTADRLAPRDPTVVP